MLHTIFYVIIFLLALVISNIINKVFPKLALPLIQVVIGLCLGFLGASKLLQVDPEFFLGFIIAPLLFRESEEADVKHIFKHTRTILMLIFPLVFITTIGLGYLTHFFYLSVPLAACFALGASLAPTDAIAVVVAGVMQANGLKRTTLFDAQVTKVKNTIWNLLTFVLNSTVFLFLGIELHQLVFPLIADPLYSTTSLLFMVLLLTLGLFALRFSLLAIYYRYVSLRRNQSFSAYWNDILLLTFAGSKGTVSIATVLLLPRTVDIPHSLIIFLCAAVTALSFLTGLFVLPLIAAKKVVKVDNMVKISILADVVRELENDLKQVTKEKARLGYNIAIDSYQDRIQKLIIEQESSNTSIDFNELQLLIVRLEAEGLENALRQNEISMYTYRTYQRYLHSMEQSVAHNLVSSIQFASAISIRVLHFFFSRIIRLDFSFRKTRPDNATAHREITELYFSNTELVLQALDNLESVYDERLIHYLQAERLRSAEFVARGGYITGILHRAQPNNLKEMMRAYYLERKTIFEYESRGELTIGEAKVLRQNVNTLEDYSLASNHHTLLYDFIEKRRKKVQRTTNNELSTNK